MKQTNKLYVVRVFNDKVLSDRFYDNYFFTEYEQDMFYTRVTAHGFKAVKL